MKPAWPALTGEFRDGWRILLGAALAAGTGVGMVFLNFSMFVLPLSQELGVSRGDLGSVQALIASLNALPPHPALQRVREQDD